MRRILLIWLFFVACAFTACTKSALYGNTQSKAQGKIEAEAIQRYLAAHGLTGIAKHAQNNDTVGVYYIIVDTSSQATLFTSSTQIVVGDTAKLLTSGKTIYETNDFHPSYALGATISAWRLGIPEVNAGGEIRLIVPSRYAYGHYPPSGQGIPPDCILDFYIRLYSVTN
jgi:FKBP-type peptidyl-prolyl cis-trans isomerase FkpA